MLTLESTTTTPPPINTHALIQRCIGNTAFAGVLLAELERDGQERVEKIASSIAKSDFQDAADVAHALKGAAAILAAEDISKIAGRIEAACRSDQSCEVESLRILAEDLGREMQKCLAFISNWREKMQRS